MNVLFETGAAGSEATSHDWLTPPEILAALGEFDLDPCASQYQPWRTAREQFTILDDGLAREWAGRVWCNPPYGPHAAHWLERCAAHGDAIALVFARTETAAFHDHVWPKADAILFLRGRLQFRLPGGGALCRERRRPFRSDRVWQGQRGCLGFLRPGGCFREVAGGR